MTIYSSKPWKMRAENQLFWPQKVFVLGKKSKFGKSDKFICLFQELEYATELLSLYSTFGQETPIIYLKTSPPGWPCS